MLSSRIIPNVGIEQYNYFIPNGYANWTGFPQSILNTQYAGASLPPTIPYTSVNSTVRCRQSRLRSMTPDIVIERRRRHHGSSGRSRIIRIPLDDHPTLGLRTPPKRVLELERVRCRRHRKRHSSCYGVGYDHRSPSPPPPPPPPQPPIMLPIQSNFMISNSIPNSSYSLVQSPLVTSDNNSTDVSTLLSNLTPEMIESLPRQTVYLPPIHLPGSQGDTNTALTTVILPAEIIDPVDGSLSIIQSKSATNVSETANSQPVVPFSSQLQLNTIPVHVPSPSTPLPIRSGPFMQQVQNLFQRFSTSQPIKSQYNAMSTVFNNSQTIDQNNGEVTGPYPPANIQSIQVPKSEPYNTLNFTSSNPTNTMPYSPANITPYRQVDNLRSDLLNNTSYQTAPTVPYLSTNIATANNNTPYRSAYTTLKQTSSSTNTQPYHAANITPYQSLNTVLSNPTKTTPHQSSIFASSDPINPTSVRANNPISSTITTIGPYRPANITSYNTRPNLNSTNSILRPSIRSATTSYSSPSSLVSLESINSPRLNVNNPPRKLINSSIMPKSILRNATPNRLSNTTYTRSIPLRTSSSNGIVRQTETYV